MREKTARRRVVALVLCAVAFLSSISLGQQSNSSVSSGAAYPTPAPRTYPKEIRGYKVELAKVETKRQGAEGAAKSSGSEVDEDALIQLGEPRVASLSPLGITLEIPVTVAAVKQGGRVDFLTFEDMTVNGTSVTFNEYQHPFDLPNDHPLTLPDPVSLYISTPRVMLGVLGEWSQSKDVWPVRGRTYVFGRFKKFLFKFKRVIPVELNLSFRNPLKNS
jgi:cell division septation protein DedD